jgi:hypothetical protein
LGVKGGKMAIQDYGEEFYKTQYELLAKGLRERDLKIVELQKVSECLQERLNELAVFENFVQVSKQFFGIMFQAQKKIS